MRLYIAGPMRGQPGHGFPAFDRAKEYLQSLGIVAISPADASRALYPEYDFTTCDGADFPAVSNFSPRDIILMDLKILDTCDGVYALHGWRRSRGAFLEVAYADFLALPVYFESFPMVEEALKRALHSEAGASAFALSTAAVPAAPRRA